ncbi:MAG TPA: alpha/beta hydrolase [Candidatus Saccharimonadales bacterium]|nr:alpha/beta hydrolase [Candidatus Saccharimonadales bacterium]
MKNAIILHGTCSRREYYDGSLPPISNRYWYPWLQRQLMVRDITASVPEIPLAFKPDYEIWKREAERFDVGPQTLIVGHSTGAGFWVRWLSEHPGVRVGKVVLVAPWLDPNNIKKTTFFDFEFDEQLVKRTEGLAIFASDNDHLGIKWSVETFRDKLPGHSFREFQGFGHFMDIQEFPELLDELLGNNN